MINRPIRTFARAVALSAALGLLWTHGAAGGTAADLDGDGIPNIVDPDIDNDGIPNALDRNIDGGIAKTGPYAGKYIGDHLDNDNPAEKDIDGDGLPDDALGERDVDADGKLDDAPSEDDIDGDRRADDSPGERDIDGDGRLDDDDREDDVDGDGLDDDDVMEGDIDGDDRSDDGDDDIDGDNRGNADSAEDDTDGDGRKDEAADEMNDDGDSLMDRDDSDDDNDGVSDEDDSDHHGEDDEQSVEVNLTAQPAAPGGSRSRVELQRMATGKIELTIDARNLPVGTYDVVVNGTLLGPLVMEQDGNRTEGEQRFETNPNKPDELPITIDVIGLPIAVEKDGVVYYAGTVPTPPESNATGSSGTGELRLTRGETAPAGSKATVSVEFGPLGAKELEIELEDVSAGNYEVFIGDASRTVMAVSGGSEQVQFKIDADPGEDELPLNFPVAGAAVSISKDGVVVFFGTLPAGPGGTVDPGADDNGGGQPVVAALTKAPELSGEASGEVQVQFGAAGAVGFEVEVEAIPAGNYDLWIGGELRAVLMVADAGNGPEGKLRFEIVPDAAAGELPLDFAVSGQAVTILQGETVYFSGTVPTQP